MISFGIAAVVVAHHEDKIIDGEWESIFQWAFSWQSTNILDLFIYLFILLHNLLSMYINQNNSRGTIPIFWINFLY